MKKSAYLLVAAMLFSTAVLGADIQIRGGRSCGKWVEDRQKERSGKRGDWVYASSNIDWLLGYLSGLAVGLRNDFLTGTDNASITLWVDNYCSANPLKHVDDAGDELAVQLVRQKR